MFANKTRDVNAELQRDKHAYLHTHVPFRQAYFTLELKFWRDLRGTEMFLSVMKL